MARSKPERVSEEKLLNDMWIVLEYSDNFKEFINGLSRITLEKLQDAIDERNEKGN